MELYNRGEYSSALKVFLKDATHDFHIGMCYYYLHNQSKALRHLRKVNTSEASYYIGDIFYRQRKYVSAIEEYSKIPDDHELGMMANYYSGLCNGKMRKWEDMELCLRKVVSLNRPNTEQICKDAKRVLMYFLIKANKIEELIKMNPINEVNDIGKLLLVESVKYENCILTHELLRLRADPFKQDGDKVCAFSEALSLTPEDFNDEAKHVSVQLIASYLTSKQYELLRKTKDWRHFFLHIKDFHSKGELNDDIFEKIKPFAQDYFKSTFDTDFLGKEYIEIIESEKDTEIILLSGETVSLNQLIKSYITSKEESEEESDE